MLTERKSSRVSRWLAVLLLLSLLAALLPLGVGAAADDAKCARYYEVNKNSTLDKIGSAFGFSGEQIAYTNELPKPFTIYVGQKLCIPEKKDKSLPNSYKSINGTIRAAYFVAGLTADNKILIHPYSYPNTSTTIKVRSNGLQSRQVVQGQHAEHRLFWQRQDLHLQGAEGPGGQARPADLPERPRHQPPAVREAVGAIT